MKDRIKQIRKYYKLNQTDFGKRIGVKQTTVAGYETGAKNPTNAIILSLCREFGINEDWLRVGNGDMFRSLPEDDEASAFVSSLQGDSDNDLFLLIKEIMRTYSQLDEPSKTVIKQFSNNLLDNLEEARRCQVDPALRESDEIIEHLNAADKGGAPAV